MGERPIMKVTEADGTVHERVTLQEYRIILDGGSNRVQAYTFRDEDTGYSWIRNVPVPGG
jgi:hypothetical protein